MGAKKYPITSQKKLHLRECDLKKAPTLLPRPNIYKFNDLKTFLNEWLRYLQSLDSNNSIRKIAKDCGLSAGFLSFVFSGRRILSKNAFLKLSHHLNLKEEEIKYLGLLSSFGSAKSHQEKSNIFDEIQSMQAKHSVNIEEADSYNYLSNSLNVIVREMAFLNGFKLEAKWILNHLTFKAPLKKINEAIKFLINKRFIKVNAEGKTQALLKNIYCSSQIFKIAYKQYHDQMLKRAQEALESGNPKEYSITGRTLNLNETQYQKILEILNQADSEIDHVENEKQAHCDRIYQLQVALFPLANVDSMPKKLNRKSIKGGKNE